MQVPAGRSGSWEDLLHRVSPGSQLLLLDELPASDEFLKERGHRAIGVVYRPHYEQFGNYVPTVLPRRYDAFIFCDQSQSVHPLEIAARRSSDHDAPETFPTGY